MPHFVVEGWIASDSCSISFDLVDVAGKSAAGWITPGLIGLDWFYRSNGLYDMSCVAYVRDCQGIGSVRLEYTSEDGTDDHCFEMRASATLRTRW